MALGNPVQVKTLSGDAKKQYPHACPDAWLYPAVRVAGLGWKSACGIRQYFHRRMGARPGPWGAALPCRLELRKDAPLPEWLATPARSFFTFYIVHFMMGEWRVLKLCAAKERYQNGNWPCDEHMMLIMQLAPLTKQ